MRHSLGVGWIAILAGSLAGCGSSNVDRPADDSAAGSDSTGAAGSMSAGTAGDSPGNGGSLSGSAGGSVTGTGGTSKPGTGGAGGSSVAPPSSWTNVTANLANMTSECGTLTMVSSKPGSNMVIAGIAKQGLWATTDGGKTWAQLGNSSIIPNRPTSLVYDPEHPDVFWESGIYNGKGVFRTDDAGKTFKQLGTIDHNDLVSVDFTDPERKTLLAGAHETKRKLWLSTDAGVSWKDIGMNLPADSHFSSAPLVLGPQSFLLGACGYGMGACGVYASADGGTTWTKPSAFSAAGAPLLATDKTIYWTLIYDSGISKSGDQGTTWTKAGSSLTDHPLELPDARIVTMGAKGQLLASKDQGKTWKPM